MSQAPLNVPSDGGRALRRALADLCAEADIRYTAVVQDAGIVIAEQGDHAHRDQGETGAIATGAFFAAQTLARRLGEEEFAGLHYEGRHRHFFLTALTSEFFLLCVFANETRIAIVRACLARALPAIRSALADLACGPPAQGDLTLAAPEPGIAARAPWTADGPGPFAPVSTVRF